MPAFMIQGCGSDVGKSVLVAGLCRLFTNRGLRVRPFKAQNMSNNAAVTADGGEIGRAQALQAIACRVAPSVHMNPVLLKPQSDRDAQIVLRGKVLGTASAQQYDIHKRAHLNLVLESFRMLEAESDLVIVEGAGSPAETNLRARDITNMGFAEIADVPVILVGDIDRGHVIASLVGAHTVLSDADRTRIKGFLINKFRGDPKLFDEGRTEIEHRTGWRDMGLVPWLGACARLPSEDAVVLEKPGAPGGGKIRIAVPMLSRIANFDDFDPLKAEENVALSFVPPGTALPGDAHLVIIPGTKATIADMEFFREQGWDIDLFAHLRRGGRVLGICGGYQMLGRSIADPDGIEGDPREAPGLGLLDIETVLTEQKILRPASGTLARTGARFEGYEMHMGRTSASDQPFLIFDSGIGHGAVEGAVAGCYVHGLFGLGEFRKSLFSGWGASSNGFDQDAIVDAALDEIAAELEKAIDIPALEQLFQGGA